MKRISFSASRIFRFTLGLCVAWLSGLSSIDLSAHPVTQMPQNGMALQGHPLGVLEFEVSLPDGWSGNNPQVVINEKSNRVFYPAVVPVVSQVLVPQERLFQKRIGRPDGLIDRVRSAVRPPMKEIDKTTGLKIFALFSGDAPLEIEVCGDLRKRTVLQVTIQAESLSHSDMLSSWWQAVQHQAANLISQDRIHSVMQHYLTSMLSRRLGLELSELPRSSNPTMELLSWEESKPKFVELMESTLGTEQSIEQAVRRVLAGPLVSDEPTIPVPPDPYWEPAMLPQDAEQSAAEVPLEEIALRIPPECFYLRFGSYGNYLWFQELGKRFGGDVASAVVRQALNYESMARVERMLATRTSTVSMMFGDKIVKDMAFFGSDLYFNDGPSLAVVLHSTNPALLKASLDADRKSILSDNPDASLVPVLIRDRQASLLSTPDNRIRGYLLVDGPYVVLSTSQKLVERFIEVEQNQQSIGSSPMFHWVRSRMPVANQYSVFGYFPPEFFQRLLSPHYQIELQRRQSAIAHLQLAELASLTAQAEIRQWDRLMAFDALEDLGVFGSRQQEKSDTEALVDDLGVLRDAKILPDWFDVRSDGSQLLRLGDRWIDSNRGAQGSFLPIADAQIHSVSEQEAADYARTAEYFQENWKRMDPLFFGLRRFQWENPSSADSGRSGRDSEQFTFEAYLSPFEPRKYGWVFEQLAPPGPVSIRFPADDKLSLQMRLQGPGQEEDYYLFGGLKDMLPPPADEVQGLIQSLRFLKSAPAYVGAWPKPDLIENLPLGIGSRLARPDFAGYSRVLGGLWRWQDDQLSLLSFHKSILDSACREIGVEQSTDSAQIRFSLADLDGSQIAEWVDQLWWENGWKSSRSNAAFLNSFHQQFRVPVGECPQAASRLLNAQLQCALGGEFQPGQGASGSVDDGFWRSTAWEAVELDDNEKPIAPSDYTTPWIQWLKEAQFQVTQQTNSLSVVGLVNVELPPVSGSDSPNDLAEGALDPPTSKDLLPIRDFNVFELPLKLFGKKGDSGAEKNESIESVPKRQNF